MDHRVYEHKYTNKLIDEKSPYLLQHSHNPVDWFPWSEEAFEKAKLEDKSIFLSIGYSTCHWCHVMERESFEDEEVAGLLNNHFVSIKVDREERPDIDHVYMTVCQALTGHGGWPLTIIMTPEKKPFFAGTYFPKENRRGHFGLMSILRRVADLWNDDRNELLESSEKITKAMKSRFNQSISGEVNEEILHKAYKQLEQNFDENYGGFYEAPKFPTPHQYMFLMRYFNRTKEKKALEMVEKSLKGMYQGGIYDHIGYGFARYSTDEKWLVPHFEKMLYDNALLAYTYLEAFQLTGNKKFARTAEEIFTYILRDMHDSMGGFYSAEDADSEGVEGKFYVWDKDEITQFLGEKDSEIFCEAYNIIERGNFEGKNIPNLINQDLSILADKFTITKDELEKKLARSREILFDYREKRIHPYKDDKILTSWNGLMIAALAKGAQVLQNQEYSDASAKAIEFILNNLISDEGRLLARYRDGESAFPAYLDDYAFLIWGLIEQYEATFNPFYLEKALEYSKQIKELFWDNANGGFFFYGKDAENLFARPKEVYDGAIPSGNSVSALNLIKLARFTGDLSLEQDAEAQIKALAGTVKEYPSGYSFYLTALAFAIGPTKEIVIAGNEDEDSTKKMLGYLQTKFLPEAVILLHSESDNNETIEEIAEYIKEQTSIEGKPTAYVCENFACQRPVTTIEELKKLV